MAQFYLVRHGQASFGTDNYDRLSELGHQQARSHVASRLSHLASPLASLRLASLVSPFKIESTTPQ